jgi:hypothetical protein
LTLAAKPPSGGLFVLAITDARGQPGWKSTPEHSTLTRLRTRAEIEQQSSQDLLDTLNRRQKAQLLLPTALAPVSGGCHLPPPWFDGLCGQRHEINEDRDGS